MSKIKWLVIWLTILTSTLGVAQARTTVDPGIFGVGARPLGMGRAYVGIDGGPSALFLNPGGLPTVKQWGVTSMYSNLLGEINYTMLGGVYPTNYGTFGLGFVGASISGCLIPTRDPDTGRISYEAGARNYYNNIIFLSYGIKLKDLIALDLLEPLSMGANLKLFTQGVTGTGGITASGYDMDVGLLYKPLSWLSVGLNQKNTLPISMGGKITWSDGEEEAIPSLTKLGTSVKLLGPQGLYRSRHELTLNLDTDFSLIKKDRPSTLHAGIEWWPIEYLGLRVGLDQDITAETGGGLGIENNLTAGVGLWLGGFQFDYAYHQYTTLAANTTHCFSLSYGIVKEKEEVPEVPEVVEIEYLKVISPRDKLITYGDSVVVRGTVAPKHARVKVRGEDVPVKDGTFDVVVPLDIGKNALSIVAQDSSGRIIATEKRRVLRLKTFRDVLEEHWAKENIEYLATVDVIAGFPDGTFKPEGNITRAEFATLLVKAKELELPPVPTALFRDVRRDYWAAPHIRAAMLADYVIGYPDKTYRPRNNISRAEGVTVLTRFNGLPKRVVITAPFADMPPSHWAAGWIVSAREGGLLGHFVERRFEPHRKLTRAETVDMLSRTRFGSEKIDWLLDWEVGY